MPIYLGYTGLSEGRPAVSPHSVALFGIDFEQLAAASIVVSLLSSSTNKQVRVYYRRESLGRDKLSEIAEKTVPPHGNVFFPSGGRLLVMESSTFGRFRCSTAMGGASPGLSRLVSGHGKLLSSARSERFIVLREDALRSASRDVLSACLAVTTFVEITIHVEDIIQTKVLGALVRSDYCTPPTYG